MLTALMILIFLGTMRATMAVSCLDSDLRLAAFLAAAMLGGSHQHHGAGRTGAGVLAPDRQLGRGAGKHLPSPGRWASRLTWPPRRAARKSQLPVLAATFTTAIVFFPVVFLYGVSKYLFTALALAVVLSLVASYLVAMTVVPLFCARFIKSAHGR